MTKEQPKPAPQTPAVNEDQVLRRLMQMPPDPGRKKLKKGTKKPAK